MSTQLSRRSMARGAAWAIPTIAVAAPAPALAASPCAGIVKGKALPATAFQPTYICDTNETFGDGITPKQLAVEFGFTLTSAALACGVTGSITSSNSGLTSRVRLSNGAVYNATNGGSVPANGTAGTVDGSCRSGLNGTEACGTSGASAYNVAGATNTSSIRVNAISLVRQITVAGYGTTTVYLNGTGISGTPGTNNCATSLSASAAPLF